MEQFSEEAPLEHKDISGERRPEHSLEAAKRARAEFFSDLMEETLGNYYKARKEDREGKSPLQNIEFFFKRAWDNFTEPLLEYEDMLADIMLKKWESKGAKSRALNGLKERRAKTLEAVKIVLPDFGELDFAKQRKAVAKLYEEYAGFIHGREADLDRLAAKVALGWPSVLQTYLGTRRDEFLKQDMERMLEKKKRRKERRAGEHQGAAPQGG